MFNPQAVQQRVDAYQNNPQALMQKYAMSQELLDLLALQQIQKQKQDAARQMAMQMGQGGQPPTVADQVEKETFDMTRQDLAQKLAPVAQAQQMQPPGPAQQGIAANPAPNISQQGFAGGGIVGYEDGGRVRPSRRGTATNRLRDFWEQFAAPGKNYPDLTRFGLTPEQATAAMAEVEQDEAAPTEESPAAPELMLSAPGPGGRAKPPRRTAEERKGVDDKEERGDSRTSVPAERMLAAQPQGLESLLDKYLRGELGAEPDYSQVDAYGRLVTDPTKDIQRRRMEEGVRREQEAAQLLEQRLAGMQPQKDRWRRVLESAAANMDVSKPFGGLQGLAAAGGTVDESDAARAEKEALLKVEHAKTVAALRDAGFGFEEAMVKADELLFGKRTEADKAAAARRAAGAEGIGEEVRSRRTEQTQLQLQRMRDASALAVARERGVTGSPENDRAVRDAEQAFARDPRALALKKQMESIVVARNPQRMADLTGKLEAIRQEKYREFGVRMGPESSGNAAANDPLGIR